jgi:RNA polymerase sigma-70 factor (ECF subfamily)
LLQVEPASVRDFFALVAEQLRRELLDLARRHAGAHRQAASLVTRGVAEPIDRSDDPSEMERWTAFHEGVANLPAEEREVFGLIFYHCWTQAEVAQLFQISERTVRRRLDSALVKLRALRNGPASWSAASQEGR